MGGGPTSSEDEHYEDEILETEPSRATFQASNATLAFSQPPPQQQFQYQQQQSASVLPTAGTAAIVGALLGTLVGLGPRTGLLFGAIAGSYTAAREDDLGQRARALGEAGSKFATDIKTKVSAFEVSHKVQELDAQYDISSKMKKAMNATITTAEESVIPKAVNLATVAHDKLKEIDSGRYMETAEQKFAEFDHSTGFSSAFSRTSNALLNEIKLKTSQ